MRRALVVLAVTVVACTTVPTRSVRPTTSIAVTASPTPAGPSPTEPAPSAFAFRFDVENRSSVNAVVSVVSDYAAWMPGFAPGERGTIEIDLLDLHNGIYIEIQDGQCGLLGTARYPTPTPFTLVIEDGSDGAVRLATRSDVSPSPIPLPSNAITGCGG